MTNLMERDFRPIADSVYARNVAEGRVAPTKQNYDVALNTAFMAEFKWKSTPSTWHQEALGNMGISLTQLREMPTEERRDLFSIMQEVSYDVLEIGKTEGVTA